MIIALASFIGTTIGYKVADIALRKTQAKKAGKRIEA
jgi:hypothetical protein